MKDLEELHVVGSNVFGAINSGRNALSPFPLGVRPSLIYVSFNLSAEASFNIACKFNRAWQRLVVVLARRAALTYGIRAGACSVKC